MTPAPVCPYHNVEARWKNPGISKNGKPYSGFWACPQKNADSSFCSWTPPQIPGPTNDQPKPTTQSDVVKALIAGLHRIEAKIDQLVARSTPAVPTYPAPTPVAETDEIRVEDIPF